MFLALPCRNILDANRSAYPLAFSAVSPYARVMCSHPLLQSVFQNLSAIIKTGSLHFLLACSGGADSTALLLAFHQLKPHLSCRLTVISVNHNIRSAQESAADSAFVAELCSSLTPPLPCIIETIPEGEVARYAQERKRGIEDAARALRYRIFEKTAAAVQADLIVTAHNQSDVYETVLMRLFQGGSTASLQTMSIRRGSYIRPLITVERSSIESFLRQQHSIWREDSTNADDRYLRNRIRHHLVPALTGTFTNWHSGLDKTLQRIGLDRSFCDLALTSAQKAFIAAQKSSAGTAEWEGCKHGAVSLSAAFFDSLHPALRLRLLEQGCLQLGIEERVPLGILLRLAEEPAQGNPDGERLAVLPEAFYNQKEMPQQRSLEESDMLEDPAALEKKSTNAHTSAAGSLRLERRGSKIFLFNTGAYLALYRQKSYLLTIEQAGTYTYPLGFLECYHTAQGFFIKDHDDRTAGLGPFRLPVTIRGRRGGDRIKMSSGGLKEVKKIFNEWSVDSLARALLPIIIEDSSLRAFYGGVLGYKNWFVEEA
ncbi:MAG: tRNA lysidine(34) synthetase TilS [Treponema sp.]